MDARPAPSLMATLGVLCQDYILRQIGSRLLWLFIEFILSVSILDDLESESPGDIRHWARPE